MPVFTQPTSLMAFKSINQSNRKQEICRTLLAIFFLLWLMPNYSFAQPGYSFSSASGTYTAITGGTQHSTGSGMDDATFLVTLPFTFNFNGSAYTQVYLSENGYLSFGSTNPGASTRSAISSTNTGFELAAAFSGDLQGINSTSELRSEVTGTAPNRIFVAQWTNQQQYLGSGQSYNFQIRLEEANGVALNQLVRFVYGGVSSTTATNTYQVGLRGSANTSFVNRTTTTNWSSTTAGTTNADACTVSSTVAPASGLTYTWTPIPMTYSSSTTTQSLTSPVIPGSTNQQIIGVQVVTTGNVSPLTLTALALNTTGTTAVADLVNAKVYYTGTSATFATTTQFGSTVNSPSGSFSVTGSQALSGGTNYFWVTYDIAAGATINNVVDAQCTQITVSSQNYTPTVTSPAGSRTILTPLSGTYTIGAGGNYTTLTAAANIISAAGVSGPVTFSLIDNNYSTNETFPITFGVIPGASAVNTLTIRPAAGVTPTISGNASAILLFSGTDFVTINGSNSNSNTVDLTISNGSTGASAVVAFGSLGIGAGATNNTLRNCYIIGGSATATAVIGISVASATISTSGTGADNDNITITNNYVNRAYFGIYARGVASTGMNDNLVISNNFIGSANSASSVLFAGIDVQNASNPSITGNNIFNMSQSIGLSTSPYGIGIGGTITTGSIIGNIINGVRNPNSGGWGAYGINVTGTITTLNIINNDISDISTMNYSTTSTTFNAFGIRITTTGTFNVYNNSVNLFGAVPNVGITAHFSAAFMAISGTTIDLRNNVFVNSQTGLAGAKSYAIYTTVANTVFASTTNRNNYFVSGANGVLGFIGAADQTSLAAWQTAIAASKDANSISSTPAFNANNNLRPVSGSALLNNGGNISSVTTDLRGATRNATTPTIGAYEIAGEFINPALSFTPLTNIVSTANRTTTNFATITDASGVNTTSGTRPRLYYKKTTNANVFAGNTSADNGWKWVEANNTTSPFDFTINYALLTGGGVSPGEQIQYFVIAQDIASIPNVIWSTGNSNPFGFNNTPASVALTASNFPVWGTYGVYSIAQQLSGTYLIGTGQQFTSLTNSGGFFEFVNNNAVSGNVVALVTSNLSETGTHALSQTTEVNGSGYTISIQPSAPATRTISGTFGGGLIRINGADRVTIDGRFNGSGSVNYFTISNNQASGVSGAVQLISLGNGAGATNNTIRNCNFVMPRTAASAALMVGGITFNTAGSDNDSVSFINNNVTTAAAAVVALGNAGFENDLLTITGNTVDSVTQVGFNITSARSVTVTGNTINSLTGPASTAVAAINLASNVRNATVSQNSIANLTSSGSNVFGISLGTSDSNITITRNMIRRVIHIGTSGYGGKGIDINTGLAASAIVVANNMIVNVGGDGWSGITGDANVGIRINGVSGGIRILHNTVNMYGTWNRSGATADLSAALAITNATATNIDVRNNILRNSIVNTSGTQTSYAIYSVATAITQFSNINYNNYVATGSQGVLGFFNAAQRNSLANWKAVVTTDLFSQSQAVNFVDSTADVRLTGASVGDLALRSLPVSGFTADYFNTTRGTAITYTGAHEASAFSAVVANAGPDTSVCSGTAITLGASTVASNGLTPYTFAWTPSSSTLANPVVTPTTTTTYTVNVTDAMGFTATDNVLITVNAAPATPSVTGTTTLCAGNTTSLTAAGTGSFNWFDVPVGGTALSTNASYTTPALNATDTFWVSASQNGCVSSRLQVIVTVNSIPAAPTVATPAPICAGNTTQVVASGTGTKMWYTALTGGNVIFTGDTFTTPVLNSNATYYVASSNNGCTSTSRTLVTAVVNAIPSNAVVSTPAAICAGTSTSVIANTTTGTRSWFTTVTGGTSLSSSDTLVTGTLNSTTVYYVQNTVNGCNSASRTPVTVTVNQIPAAPGIASPNSICAGTSTMIMAVPSAGTRRWYTSATGGVSIYTGDTLATGTLNTTTTYYAENTVNGCTSTNRTMVSVIVNALPAAPSVNAPAVCSGTAATFTASGVASLDSVMWYDAATAGNMLGAGNTYTTGALTSATTVYAAVKSAQGCISATRTAAAATVNSIPSAPAVSDTVICAGTAITLDYTTAAGTLNWYDDNNSTTTIATGNTFNTGVLTVADTVYVSTVISGCESSRSMIIIDATPLPAAPVASAASVCEGQAARLSATGSGPLTWYNVSVGGTPVDTGASIAISGITATTIYYVESYNGSCASASRTPVVVVFKPKPDAGFTIQGQLAGQITFLANASSGVNLNWSFGDGNTSVLSNPTHQYNTNGNYNVKLIVVNPTSGCSDSTNQSVNVLSVGIADKQANGFHADVYPNPFRETAQITYTLTSAQDVSIRVVNQLGQEVMQLPAGLKHAGTHQVDFNSANLASGVYYVRLQVGSTQHTLRVVKAN